VHRLSSSFILGYHGCDQKVGERLLRGIPFRASDNDWDWLGSGVYFWEANPLRAMEFATESVKRRNSKIKTPFVVGAVLDLGLCFDLTTKASIDMLRLAYGSLSEIAHVEGTSLPANSPDLLKRNLDCAVIERLHSILEESGQSAVDSVKGVFTEGDLAYPGAGFLEKTHIQVAIRNLACIKGVFRPQAHEVGH
jgi:hypothetical protein